MDDFAKLLPFVGIGFYTIDQAVWFACDEVPPADASSRPTQRHVVAERRIRAEVELIEGGIEVEAPMWLLHGTKLVKGREEGMRENKLMAWFRANRAFGQLFLKAVDSASFNFTGDKKEDRITAWRKLCHDIPAAQTKAWTNEQRFEELRTRHPRLFTVSFKNYFIPEIWPELRAALPLLD